MVKTSMEWLKVKKLIDGNILLSQPMQYVPRRCLLNALVNNMYMKCSTCEITEATGRQCLFLPTHAVI